MPGDLIGTMSFLASDDAYFVTGQAIVVDEGLREHTNPDKKKAVPAGQKRPVVVYGARYLT